MESVVSQGTASQVGQDTVNCVTPNQMASIIFSPCRSISDLTVGQRPK